MNLSKRTGTRTDDLLLQAPEDAARDYEETCQAIAEGLADIEARRTISFEESLARREAQKARRRENTR